METLDQSAEACQWLSKAVQLANLIASDEIPLQLHAVLRRFDVDCILSVVLNLWCSDLIWRSCWTESMLLL